MTVYRRRGEMVDAVQWTGTNRCAVLRFPTVELRGERLYLATTDGLVPVAVGEWLVRAWQGPVHRVPPGEFARMYEGAEVTPA